MIDELSPNIAASLATDGDVYCAGALSQCLIRTGFPPPQKVTAFLKFGPEGMMPTVIRVESWSGLPLISYCVGCARNAEFRVARSLQV